MTRLSNKTIRLSAGQKRRLSNFKGVYQHRGAWQAKIKLNNKSINLGRFSSQVDAAHNYDYHALNIYGSECYLNFPDFYYKEFKPKKKIGEIKPPKQFIERRMGWGRKLNKKIAHEIRRKHTNDNFSIKKLAETYDVTIASIYNILNQVTYRDKDCAKVSVIYNPDIEF